MRVVGGKPCAIGGSVGVAVSNQVVGVAPLDLTEAISSGYQVVISVPTDELTFNESSAPQATLQATTDTGYVSSIVVNLEPTGSSPSTLYEGYTAYTFAVQPSPALTAWVNSVSSQTNSTSDFITATSTAFSLAGQKGNYTIYAQGSSSQIGTVNDGSATFSDPGKPPIGSCKPGLVCPN